MEDHVDDYFDLKFKKTQQKKNNPLQTVAEKRLMYIHGMMKYRIKR